MSEMVEKVARALWAFDGPIEGGGPPLRYIVLAQTAIAAMRDYTEAMSIAGGAVPTWQYSSDHPVGQSIAERAYIAMIDAALK